MVEPPGMWIARRIADIRELRRELARAARLEESASFELTLSARRFSRAARVEADDNLGFSATLMRAGEVVAASRLIAEFERDVKEGEVALIERVNEVKVAHAARREKMTRLRLTRLLVTAVLGSSLVGASLAGVAVASFVASAGSAGRPAAVSTGLERGRTAALGPSEIRAGLALRRSHVREVAGVRLAMSPAQFVLYRLLVRSGDARGLRDLVTRLLDGNQRLAEVVVGTLVATASDAVPAGAVLEDVAKIVPEPPTPPHDVSASEPTSDDSPSTESDEPDDGSDGSEEPSDDAPEPQDPIDLPVDNKLEG